MTTQDTAVQRYQEDRMVKASMSTEDNWIRMDTGSRAAEHSLPLES